MRHARHFNAFLRGAVSGVVLSLIITAGAHPSPLRFGAQNSRARPYGRGIRFRKKYFETNEVWRQRCRNIWGLLRCKNAGVGVIISISPDGEKNETVFWITNGEVMG